MSFFLRPATLKALQAMVIAISVLFLYQTYRKAFRDIGYDLTSYLLAGEAFLAGSNPYQTEAAFPFIYPLFLCVVMVPLAIAPYWLSILLWFTASLAAFYYSASVLLRQFRPQISRQSIMLIFGIAFLLLYDILNNNFLNGQINFFVLLLCVLFFHYYQQSQKAKASWLLAIAIVTKLTPAIFFVYLFFNKDFKSIFLVMMQCLVLAVLIPFIFAGTKTLDWYAYYLDTFLTNKLTSNEQPIDSVSYALVHFISLLLPQIPKLAAFCLSSSLVLLPIVYVQLSGSSSPDNTQKRALIIFALYMLAMLLISPMSEKHHLIHAYPAIIIFLGTIAYHEADKSRRHILVLITLTILFTAGKSIPFGFFIGLLISYGFMIKQLACLSGGEHRLEASN